MSRYRKFTTICGAAVFALGLAACGGGSSGPNADQQAALEQGERDAATVTALRNQIEELAESLGVDAADVGDEIAALQNEVNRLQGIVTARMNAEEEADRKAMSAKAKALRKAIMDTAGSTVTVVSGRINIAVNDASGAALTGEDIPSGLTSLAKQSASPAALGKWMGENYMKDTGTGATKITASARTYSNPSDAKPILFASEAGEAAHGLTRATTTTPRGDYAVTAASASRIGGFPSTGTSSYDEDDTVTGTFMGAPGTYKCIASAGCSVLAAGTAGFTVTDGDWTFTPSGGAMVQQKDAAYLQFGWWVRQDKDGATHADAFYRTMGVTALTSGVINSAALVGKATYDGSAAGKFAISDPLRPANDDAGHFTADVELMADFKTADSTLSGTIDNFRLNDGSTDPGWSVELQKAMVDTTNGNTFTTAATPDDDQTVWSIDGRKGATSGAWEGQMYDEAIGAADDDSNVPTTVVGRFSSNIGTTHEMVGAFGATKRP